jgi:hypothetical protein
VGSDAAGIGHGRLGSSIEHASNLKDYEGSGIGLGGGYTEVEST